MVFYSKFLVIIAPISLMTLITQLSLMPILVGIHDRVSERNGLYDRVKRSETTGNCLNFISELFYSYF